MAKRHRAKALARVYFQIKTWLCRAILFAQPPPNIPKPFLNPMVQSRQLKVSPDSQDFMPAGDVFLRRSISSHFLLCFLSKDSCDMDRYFCQANDIFLTG